jgi:hypothetical protein
MSSFLFILLFTTTIDLRLMGTSPDEDLTSHVHVAHGLEVSSQTNRKEKLYLIGIMGLGILLALSQFLGVDGSSDLFRSAMVASVMKTIKLQALSQKQDFT